MQNAAYMTDEARETAKYLVDAWDTKVIESMFTLIDVTAGFGVTSIQTAPGLGVLKRDEFKVLSISDLYELDEAGLLNVTEKGTSRNRKWEIRLTSALRAAVKQNFLQVPEQKNVDNVDKKEGRLFISYSKQDILLRRIIENGLRETYTSVWSDDKFRGSEKWWAEILKQIANSDVFVFLISHDSINSLYCRAEFSQAFRLQKQILPLVIRETDFIPPKIADYQYVDLVQSKGIEDILTKTTAGIDRALGQLVASSSEPLWLSPIPLPNKINRLSVYADKDPQQNENDLNTGIYVIPGDKIKISAEGTITFDDTVRGKVNPNGQLLDGNGRLIVIPHQDAYPTQDLPIITSNNYGFLGSLIGWIGERNYLEEAFFLGVEREFVVNTEQEGFLHVAINDARGTYGDNAGKFDVKVKISREKGNL